MVVAAVEEATAIAVATEEDRHRVEGDMTEEATKGGGRHRLVMGVDPEDGDRSIYKFKS